MSAVWCDRLSKTAQNELMNILVIFLGLSVGATTDGKTFLVPQTLMVIALGLFAFCMGTAFGVLFGKLMYVAHQGQGQPADRFGRRVRPFPWPPACPRRWGRRKTPATSC